MIGSAATRRRGGVDLLGHWGSGRGVDGAATLPSGGGGIDTFFDGRWGHCRFLHFLLRLINRILRLLLLPTALLLGRFDLHVSFAELEKRRWRRRGSRNVRLMARRRRKSLRRVEALDGFDSHTARRAETSALSVLECPAKENRVLVDLAKLFLRSLKSRKLLPPIQTVSRSSRPLHHLNDLSHSRHRFLKWEEDKGGIGVELVGVVLRVGRVRARPAEDGGGVVETGEEERDTGLLVGKSGRGRCCGEKREVALVRRRHDLRGGKWAGSGDGEKVCGRTAQPRSFPLNEREGGRKPRNKREGEANGIQGSWEKQGRTWQQ
jgi:hypothetical protein